MSNVYNWFYLSKNEKQIHLFKSLKDARSKKPKDGSMIMHTDNYIKITSILPSIQIYSH